MKSDWEDSQQNNGADDEFMSMDDEEDAGGMAKTTVGNENEHVATTSDEMPSPPSYYPVPPSVSMVSGIAPKSGAPPPGVANGSHVKTSSAAVAQTNARATRVAGAPSRAPAGVAPVDVDIGSIADAHRHAKIAVSALGFDDVHTAIESLERALAILGNVKK